MWKYDALKQNYADLNHRLKKRMLLSLYELKTAPEADKNLAEMLLSFETWNRLIRHQGLSPDDAKAIIRNQVLPLLKPWFLFFWTRTHDLHSLSRTRDLLVQDIKDSINRHESFSL